MQKNTKSRAVQRLKHIGIIATLFTVLSLLTGVSFAFYSTFSIAGSSVSRIEYAAALNVLFMFSAANIALAVGFGWRKAVSSIVAAILLMILAVSMGLNITDGATFSPFDYADFTATTWLIVSLVIVAPVIIFSGYLVMKERSKLRLFAIGALVGVPLVVLSFISLPLDLEAREAYATYAQEQVESSRKAKEDNAKDAALQKRQEAARLPLYNAAEATVRNLSAATLRDGKIPAKVTPPVGYQIVKYTVDDATRQVRFCIAPVDVPYYYLGVIIDPTVKEGAIYWPSTPGESCYYDYRNYNQLSS